MNACAKDKVQNAVQNSCFILVSMNLFAFVSLGDEFCDKCSSFLLIEILTRYLCEYIVPISYRIDYLLLFMYSNTYLNNFPLLILMCESQISFL